MSGCQTKIIHRRFRRFRTLLGFILPLPQGKPLEMVGRKAKGTAVLEKESCQPAAKGEQPEELEVTQMEGKTNTYIYSRIGFIPLRLRLTTVGLS